MDTPDHQMSDARESLLAAFPELGQLPPGTEVFGAELGDLVTLYNITKAREITQGHRPTESVDVRRLSQQARAPGDEATTSGGFEIDPEWAMGRDLSQPLILVHPPHPPDEYADGLVIDGWHRIYKAARLGIEELQAIALTPEEETIIRIAPAARGSESGT